MRGVVRSLWVLVLALASTVSLAVAWTTATAVQLLATALIMGGTQHPLSTPPDDPLSFINPYMQNTIDEYINLAAAAGTGTGGSPISGVGSDDDRYAVITPEEFFPSYGSLTFDRSVAIGLANANSCIRGTGCLYNDDDLLDPSAPVGPPVAGDEFTVFGYSQSAVIASLLKRDLLDNPAETPTTASFFLLANPMRPNGGILARGLRGFTIPILGVTFHGATPTDSCETGTCYPTVDVAVQYDLLGGDAPASLTNVLAWVNALAGYLLLHGPLANESFDDALYQGSYGDTDYYLNPSERLPILMPFEPFVPSPILTLLDAPLRAAIEAGYARDVNPGIATGMGLLPFRNPVQAIVNIIEAIPTGIDDALSEAVGDPDFRPLGTDPVTSPFGVGGPELPPAPPPVESDNNASREQSESVAEESDELETETETEIETKTETETETEEAEELKELNEEEAEKLEELKELNEEELKEEELKEEEADEDSEVNEPEDPKVREPIKAEPQKQTEEPSTTESDGDEQPTPDKPDQGDDDGGEKKAA